MNSAPTMEAPTMQTDLMPTRNPILDPTEDETLALFAQEMAKHGGPMEAKRFLSKVANGHPAGTTHQGYQKHVRNVEGLKKSGRLAQVGVTRFGGYPTYAPAAPKLP